MIRQGIKLHHHQSAALNRSGSPALFTVPLTLLICWLMSIATAESEKDWRLAQPSVVEP
jgi:hypothetical protein